VQSSYILLVKQLVASVKAQTLTAVSATRSFTVIVTAKVFSATAYIGTFLEHLILKDTATTVDSITQRFSKSLKDAPLATDSIQIATRYLRSFTDTQTATDSIAKKVTKVSTDIQPATDSIAKKVTKVSTDIQPATDSGNYFSNSYVDPSYFSGQYVGLLTTF